MLRKIIKCVSIIAVAITVVLVIAYVVSVLNAIGLLKYERIYKEGYKTTATVVDYNYKHARKFPVLQYNIYTESYREENLNFSGEYLKKGENITIYYDKNDFKRFMIADARYFKNITEFKFNTIIVVIAIITTFASSYFYERLVEIDIKKAKIRRRLEKERRKAKKFK